MVRENIAHRLPVLLAHGLAQAPVIGDGADVAGQLLQTVIEGTNERLPRQRQAFGHIGFHLLPR